MGMLVHFFELSGLQAKETLSTFRSTLLSLTNVRSTELLENLDQPNLFLLVVQSQETLKVIPPEGVRVWTFRPSL